MANRSDSGSLASRSLRRSGESAVDLRLVDALVKGAPDAILMEDYCHSIEHSIEFQVLFLPVLIRTRYPHPADFVRLLRAKHL